MKKKQLNDALFYLYNENKRRFLVKFASRIYIYH